MGGGGGTTGEVGFPDYMETKHEEWLGNSAFADPSIEAIMSSALQTNGDPYIDYDYDDPSFDISEMKGDVGDLQASAAELDEMSYYEDAVDTAVDKVGNLLSQTDTDPIVEAVASETEGALSDAIAFAMDNIDERKLDELVQHFARRSNDAKTKNIRQFSAQMADINAVQSSAFLFGTALIEAEHLRSVNEFNTEITKQAYDQSKQYVSQYLQTYAQRLEQEIRVTLNDMQSRDRITIQSIQMMMQLFGRSFSMEADAVAKMIESNRIGFVMEEEYTSASADLEAKSALWDFKVYEYGISFLGGLGGGTRLPEAPSKASSAIGGALGGAAKGMAAGGPVGAGIGGLLGGAAGLLQ